MIKTTQGVDKSVVAGLAFTQPDGGLVHGTLTTALDRQTSHNRCVYIQGTKGYIEVAFPTYRPRAFTVHAWDSSEDYADRDQFDQPTKQETFTFEPRPGGIWGFAWEADEVARCLRDGKKESDRMPLRETLLMMQVRACSIPLNYVPDAERLFLQIFDEIRKQGEFVYPEELETLELASA